MNGCQMILKLSASADRPIQMISSENICSKALKNSAGEKMNKMVNGKEEVMGETVFTYDTNNKTLDGVTTSAKGKGLWHFVVKGNNMHGTLIVDNNVLYRLIDLHKD